MDSYLIKPWSFFPKWMQLAESRKWEKEIKENLDWMQPKVKVYGQEYLVPRKTVFLGEEGISYSYSGHIHKSIAWPNWFLPLLEKVSLFSNSNFNGCLINLYRNGNDRMGWHADNEKELDPSKSIASLSLGSTRDFCLKHRKSMVKENIPLMDGDLLIMHPPCQEEWIHSIPARKRNLNLRINLTFRCYWKEE
tara:strand:+ start:152 stop:730 length:579 start_codon:yes stop_codon:yes gene_type:complete